MDGLDGGDCASGEQEWCTGRGFLIHSFIVLCKVRAVPRARPLALAPGALPTKLPSLFGSAIHTRRVGSHESSSGGAVAAQSRQSARLTPRACVCGWVRPPRRFSVRRRAAAAAAAAATARNGGVGGGVGCWARSRRRRCYAASGDYCSACRWCRPPTCRPGTRR